MSDFNERLSRGLAGASIGGSFVSAVCAVTGSVFGPAGTFFGAAVGSGTGASIGGCLGCIGGFLGAFFGDYSPKKTLRHILYI